MATTQTVKERPDRYPRAGDLLALIGDEEVWLLAERAAFWERQRTLIVADLHWGKSEVLQQAGIALPSTPFAEDLARLSAVVARTSAQRVLILGDLIHAPSGVTPQLVDDVAAWRSGLSELQMVLLRGNHDRDFRLPSAWGMSEAPAGLLEDSFCFTHDGDHAGSALGSTVVVWSGHTHPGVVLQGGRDRLRLPCFVVGPRSVTLPAFGSLTGLHTVRPSPGEVLYAIAGSSVVAV